MEVRRLLTALHSVLDDFKVLQIPEKLTALNTAAQNLTASPSDAATNEAFFKAVQIVRDVLPEASTNVATSSARLALSQAGLDNLVGVNLLKEVDQILGATPFLIPRAAQLIQALDKQTKVDVRRLEAAVVALEGLNFEPEAIPADQYEIGVLMPSSVMKDDLRVVREELDEWIFVIDRIQELVDGNPSTAIPIRSISSGSLDLFVGFHATGTEAFLILSLGVYSIFQMVRDAQRRRSEMERERYSEVIIEHLRQHEAELIEKGKEEIVRKLMDKKSASLAATREHEMRTALNRAVAFVLRRVNEGVDVDVSTPPEADEERNEALAEVQDLRLKIESMRLEVAKISDSLPDRSTPILQLPEPTAQPDSKGSGNGVPAKPCGTTRRRAGKPEDAPQ